MTCDACGEYYFNEESDKHFIPELDIYVCDECQKKIEEHHKVDGKYVVHRCHECGKVKKVEFIKYKKRGRPLGSKSKETRKKQEEAMKRDKEQKTFSDIKLWTGYGKDPRPIGKAARKEKIITPDTEPKGGAV